jgi:hypothetical protein
MLGHYIKMSQAAIIGVVALMMMSSSVGAVALMMGGDDEKKTGPTGPTGPSGPPCERGKSVTGHTGSLGACSSLNDIKPEEVTFQGAYFSPQNPVRGADWVHELSSTATKKEFIASHQSPDNWCKMVRFEVTKDNGNCDYKVVDAGYTTSPTNASTCTTKSEVLGHWGSKNPQSLATSNDEGGYGIETFKYSKYC